MSIDIFNYSIPIQVALLQDAADKNEPRQTMPTEQCQLNLDIDRNTTKISNTKNQTQHRKLKATNPIVIYKFWGKRISLLLLYANVKYQLTSFNICSRLIHRKTTCKYG